MEYIMSNPIRVAYFDLGFSKEQYGLQPTKYGGGGVAARYLKEDPNIDFHIFAPQESFENIGQNERTDRCHVLPSDWCEALKYGAPVSQIFSFETIPDIVLHPHTCETINRGTLNIPIVQFCGFAGDAGHPGNDYILLYDDSFKPQFGERAKYVRIGKPVPKTYRPYPKAPHVFQCSRHDDHMNTIEVAKNCRRYGIQGYFAGPIHNGYPLMEHIDGVTTHYLGEIDEATKMGYHRHARLFALLPTWEVPFNQSIIETQGQGTPIWVNNRGPFFNKYLSHGVNGFDAAKTSLLEAFDGATKLNQKDSWLAARQFSVPVMVESFKVAFKEIVIEWRAEHNLRA